MSQPPTIMVLTELRNKSIASIREVSVVIGISKESASNCMRRLCREGWAKKIGEKKVGRTLVGQYEATEKQGLPVCNDSVDYSPAVLKLLIKNKKQAFRRGDISKILGLTISKTNIAVNNLIKQKKIYSEVVIRIGDITSGKINICWVGSEKIPTHNYKGDKVEIKVVSKTKTFDIFTSAMNKAMGCQELAL